MGTRWGGVLSVMVLSGCWGALRAQTFTVTAQTGTSLNLDTTTRVTLNVQYTGSTTLTSVVPILHPPSCGVVTIGSESVNIFSTAYAGWNNGSTFVVQPIPSWAPNSSKSIAFDVHLFDNPGGGNSICTNLCPGGVQFSLGLSGSGFGPVSASANGFLSMTKPETNQYRLETLFVKWDNGSPNFHVSNFSQDLLFQVVNHAPNLTTPGTKIFMYMDWHISNPRTCFTQYYQGVGQGGCAVNMGAVLAQDNPFSGSIIDGTGTIPAAGVGTGGVVLQKPLGGASGNAGSGINLLDITTKSATCGGTVFSKLGFSSSTTQFVNNLIPHDPLTWRSARIYVGVPQSCEVTTAAFGAPPTATDFLSLSTDSKGLIEAEIDVPSSWKSGSDLSSAYSIKWYLRDGSTFTQLTDSGTDGLKITLRASQSGFQPTSFLEARVTHVATGSVTRFDSPIHGFTYEADLNTFTGAEIPMDDYLDPGETVNFDLAITNQSGASASGLSLSTGIVTSQVAGHSAGTVPGTLAHGGSHNAPLQLTLLAEQDECGTLEFYYQVQHMRGSFTTSRKEYLTLTTNCQDTQLSFPSVPGDLASWCAAVNSGPCVPGLSGSGAGWIFDGTWLGTVSDPGDANKVFSLTSPPVAVGSSPRFTLSHTPHFNLNISGGVLEYSLHNGTNWGSWLDLITAIEAKEGVQIYHPLEFPDNLSSYLAGRRVWMYNTPPTAPVTFSELEVNPTLFGTASQVRFRLVFQAPYLDQRSTGFHQWELDDFRYHSVQPLLDNLFGNQPNLSFAYCDAISFNLAQVGNYQVKWFSSASGLLNDNPDHSETVTASATLAWIYGLPAPPTSTTTYYVRVQDLYSGAVRVLPLTIIVPTGGVPTLSSMMPVWYKDPLTYPFADLNGDGQINSMDFVDRENNSLCD